MKIADINTETLEGKLLVAALAMLTTESRKDQEPDKVMSDVINLKNNMFMPKSELPEIGQLCWFWDDNVPFFVYGKFDYYCAGTKFPYEVQGGGAYQYCSTTNPTEK